MQFDSLSFLCFFAVVLVFYRLPLSWSQRKLGLLVASYLFYAAWSPPFVLLIWISTIADWCIARMLHASTRRRQRRVLLSLSLVINLGLLGFFKYSQFLTDSFATFASVFGHSFNPPQWSIVLPIGISFYTFQTLSYTIDIYRRRISGHLEKEDAVDFTQALISELEIVGVL